MCWLKRLLNQPVDKAVATHWNLHLLFSIAFFQQQGIWLTVLDPRLTVLNSQTLEENVIASSPTKGHSWSVVAPHVDFESLKVDNDSLLSKHTLIIHNFFVLTRIWVIQIGFYSLRCPRSNTISRQNYFKSEFMSILLRNVCVGSKLGYIELYPLFLTPRESKSYCIKSKILKSSLHLSLVWKDMLSFLQECQDQFFKLVKIWS